MDFLPDCTTAGPVKGWCSMSQQNQQGLLQPPEKSPSATLAEPWQEQTSSTESNLLPWLRERHRRAMWNGTGEKLK